MLLTVRVNGSDVKAPVETWVGGLVRVLGVCEDSANVRCVAGPATHPLRVELDNGESVTHKPDAWLTLIFRRMDRLDAVKVCDRVRMDLLSYVDRGAVSMTDGKITAAADTVVAHVGSEPPVAAAIEEWVAAITTVLSGPRRNALLQAVKRGVPVETPGRYVLHAEGLNLIAGGGK